MRLFGVAQLIVMLGSHLDGEIEIQSPNAVTVSV